MKRVNLDLKKLLGFRIIANQSSSAKSVKIGSKIGSKIGFIKGKSKSKAK